MCCKNKAIGVCVMALLTSLITTSIAYAADDMAMEWPVSGVIVMGYSMDRLIYDTTLDQFRTNNNVAISAVNGDIVKSVAGGVVKFIFKTKAYGNTVVIEHGNSLHTTYGQLQDDILVSVGDVVTTGQSIGSVGIPTIFTEKLGSHLIFEVIKDSEYIDPIEILAK